MCIRDRYSYPAPVTVRQIEIKKQNNAYQSQRFIIQQSDEDVYKRQSVVVSGNSKTRVWRKQIQPD